MKSRKRKELMQEKLKRSYFADLDVEPLSEEKKAELIALAEELPQEPTPEVEVKAPRHKGYTRAMGWAMAFVLVFCVAGVFHALERPDAEADGEKESRIVEGMETIDSYSCLADIPEEIRETFLMFDEIFADFATNEIKVKSVTSITVLQLYFRNESGEKIYIEQIKGQEDGLVNVLKEDHRVETWDGIEVYIKDYASGEKEKSYKLIYNNIFVRIQTSPEIEETTIKQHLSRAVSQI